MNWRLVAIPVTLVPILAIAVQFDIGIDDIFAVGLWPFLGAVGLVMAKITLQGIKFAYIARTYIGKSFDSIKMLTGVRMGSEFIKFTNSHVHRCRICGDLLPAQEKSENFAGHVGCNFGYCN